MKKIIKILLILNIIFGGILFAQKCTYKDSTNSEKIYQDSIWNVKQDSILEFKLKLHEEL